MDGIRNILIAREKMWQNWQTCEAGLLRKREAVTRLQATGRTEKIPQAELEIKGIFFKMDLVSGDVL